MTPPRRILIPILAGLGNSLMAMPLVRQMKAAWPQCRITILARSGAMGEPFRRMPDVVDEVLITGVALKALFRSFVWTRQRRPDVYLVPFPSNRWHYSLLALTSGARHKILHRYPVAYWRTLGFVGQRIPAQRGIHDVAQNLRLLTLLGVTPDETEAPSFPVTDADRARADDLLVNAGLPNSAFGIRHSAIPYLAIHAGSGSYTVIARAKRWPPQRYAELIAAIRREFPEHHVLMLEGPDEAGVADEIARCLSPGTPPGEPIPGFHTLRLAGPLGEAAAVLQRAALYAGSDSGLAHLAAAVGTRAVTIFAPADPDRVCPFGNRDLVVQTDRPCSPCFTYPFQTPYPDSKCRPPFCIESVTVDRVLAAVKRGLGVKVGLRVPLARTSA